MDRLWVGEAAGFTEWLRLAHDPNVLRSMALDFVALEDAAVLGVLEHLGLRLLPGMNREDLERTLGPPARVLVFPRATDRETLTFPSQGPGGYDLSCTVQRATGLSYLVVMRGDWASVPSP